METKTGTPFRQIMLEQQESEYRFQLESLLSQPYVKRTNHGFEIDLLQLVDRLNKKQKEDLQKYLLIQDQPHS